MAVMSDGQNGTDRYAGLAARLLKEQPVPGEAHLPDGRRDELVAALALAIVAKRRRRRLVLGVAGALAAAAAALLVVEASLHVRQAPAPASEAPLVVEDNLGAGNALVRNAVQRPLVDGIHLVEGDSIQADQRGDQSGRATLGFANGTRLTLSAAGRLRVDELAATRRFALQGGHLRAQVAKLLPGERFIVDTPDAEVEVRGTLFSVSVAPAQCGGAAGHQSPQSTQSRVEVSEGAVWVHAGTVQALLHAGESWTSPCAEGPASGAEQAPAGPADPDQSGASAAHSVPRPAHHLSSPAAPHARTEQAQPAPFPSVAPPAAAVPPAAVPGPASAHRESHLAEQNNLFSAAMAAEHRGDHATAARKLDELISRFPSGPLLESARAERQRIRSAQPSEP